MCCAPENRRDAATENLVSGFKAGSAEAPKITGGGESKDLQLLLELRSQNSLNFRLGRDRTAMRIFTFSRECRWPWGLGTYGG